MMSDALKITFWVSLILVALLIFGLVFGWIALPFEKASPANVENQFTTGYETMKQLEASARNVCSIENLIRNTTDDSAKNQRQSQLLQYQANYSRIKGDYDAWAANIFQGKVVRPSDLPAVAPDLSQMKLQVCDK